MTITETEGKSAYQFAYDFIMINNVDAIAKAWSNDMLMIEEQRKEIANLVKNLKDKSF